MSVTFAGPVVLDHSTTGTCRQRNRFQALFFFSYHFSKSGSTRPTLRVVPIWISIAAPIVDARRLKKGKLGDVRKVVVPDGHAPLSVAAAISRPPCCSRPSWPGAGKRNAGSAPRCSAVPRLFALPGSSLEGRNQAAGRPHLVGYQCNRNADAGGSSWICSHRAHSRVEFVARALKLVPELATRRSGDGS
jgi:hypothetical protein